MVFILDGWSYINTLWCSFNTVGFGGGERPVKENRVRSSRNMDQSMNMHNMLIRKMETKDGKGGEASKAKDICDPE